MRILHHLLLGLFASAAPAAAAELGLQTAVELNFTVPGNRFVQLESSPDLAQWSPVGSWVLRQPEAVKQLVPAADATRFYRANDFAVRSLDAELEPIRQARTLPALGCAVIRSNRVVGFGVAGVRKWNVTEPVTAGDLWHHGSLTKSMTATLAAILVEEGRLQWTTKLVEVFPTQAAKMDAGWKTATLELLLANRGGAPEDLNASGLWTQLWNHPGTPREQRLLLLEKLTALPPKSPPGTAYEYSNAGFALAGAMLEQVMGKPWEKLMTERLFKPLGMTSAGFGVPATPRQIDQPWGHIGSGSTRTPMAPGTDADNPPGIGPAGTVHCSLEDFARYVAFHLAGERGQTGLLLTPASFAKLHTAFAGQDYALGWNVGDRPWAGGKTLTHTGSNLQWFTNVWLAPNRDWAVVVVTNFGGAGAFEATDAVVAKMISLFPPGS